MAKQSAPKTEYQTAVIYARYSSHAQRDVSIEQQKRACRQFAERKGIQILTVYEDHAMTGTNDKRPGFQRMIHDAAKADWSYVIVYSLDRFARDRYDSAIYKRQLKNAGIRVLSAMENISDDPTGVLMESLLEGLAEYYSKELGSKVRRGMTDNATRCQVNGVLPLGYVKGPDSRYAINDEEAAIVREIFERISSQEPMINIVRDFNRRGLKTKRGHDWNKSSFNSILSNERYIGTYIYGDTKIPGGIPPIISQELFDRVQYAISSKNNPRSLGPRRRRREKTLYMLTGKLFCGDCKEPMVGICGTAKSGNYYHYYTCRGKLHHKCSRKNIPKDDIELFITSALAENMLSDQAIEALADQFMDYQAQQLAKSDVGCIQLQLQETERSIDNLIKAMEMGIFSQSTQARLQELEHQRQVLSGQLAIAQESARELLTREDLIALLKCYQDGDIRDKAFQQALVDTFLVAAYVYDDHVTVVFRLTNDPPVKILPFDIDSIVSDPDTGTCITGTEGDHSVLYKPCGTMVIMIHGLFVCTRNR